ncbi:MAG: polyamine aminopropyltransferase [Defluviitaleaceae bacterium]|nr:polyamine aminopropyltransferase [Defluviitaleaceae bacterium]
MHLWFSEIHTPHVRLDIQLEKPLFNGKSEYQTIDIYETKEFGRILIMDGFTMLTEKDEFVYHDMLAHVPMAVNPDIKSVLIIGAGDGGMVRELVRYDSIKIIDMVEIDKMVVDACREFLPLTASKLDDPRVNLFYEDGLRFVRRKSNEYDLIVVDSTDPFGPGEGLFTKEFYGNCYNALTENGIMVNQLGGAFYKNDILSMQRAFGRINSTFDVARAYQAHVPTYPGGHWLFGFGTKGLHPTRDIKAEQWNKLGIKTGYYNTKLHEGCFALPNNVLEMLKEGLGGVEYEQ